MTDSRNEILHFCRAFKDYVTVRSSVHRCISAQRLLVITVLGITEQYMNGAVYVCA